MKKRAYAHITQSHRILRGIPIVAGTRTPVRSIAGYYQMGMTADEILQNLPHLTLAKIHAALAYNFDHQREIDRDLSRSRDVNSWKRRGEKRFRRAARCPQFAWEYPDKSKI